MWVQLLGTTKRWLAWRYSQSLWGRVNLTCGGNINLWTIYNSLNLLNGTGRESDHFYLIFSYFSVSQFSNLEFIIDAFPRWLATRRRGSLQANVSNSLESGTFVHRGCVNAFSLLIVCCNLLWRCFGISDCLFNAHCHHLSSQQSVTTWSIFKPLQLSF